MKLIGNMSNSKVGINLSFKPKAGSKIGTDLINKFTSPFVSTIKAPTNNTNDSSGMSYKQHYDNLCDLEREQIIKEYEIKKAMAIDRALTLAYYKRDLAKACFNTQFNIYGLSANIFRDGARALENYIDNVELKQGKPIEQIIDDSIFLKAGKGDNDIILKDGENGFREAEIVKCNSPIKTI